MAEQEPVGECECKCDGDGECQCECQCQCGYDDDGNLVTHEYMVSEYDSNGVLVARRCVECEYTSNGELVARRCVLTNEVVGGERPPFVHVPPDEPEPEPLPEFDGNPVPPEPLATYDPDYDCRKMCIPEDTANARAAEVCMAQARNAWRACAADPSPATRAEAERKDAEALAAAESASEEYHNLCDAAIEHAENYVETHRVREPDVCVIVDMGNNQLIIVKVVDGSIVVQGAPSLSSS
jgi:hypothetical protein